MPILTPVWKLPYPAPTDPPNGFGQVQALAQAVDAGLSAVKAKTLCVVTTSADLLFANNTTASVPFDTVLADTDSSFNAANPNRLTVVTPGWYLCTAVATFAANVANSRYGSFTVNDTAEVARFETGANQSAGARGTSISTSTVLHLNVGDFLKFTVWQNSGGSLSLAAGARMTVHMVHA